MLNRVLMGTTCLALMGVALWNMRHVTTGVPAFDGKARVEGVYGDWRTPYGPAHYNRAEYLQQLSEAYLRADIVDPVDEDAVLDIEAEEAIAQERAERAEELLLESLSLSPANAHVWATLSWAQALQGEATQARETMEVSWQLAPNNVALARTRLAFAEFLAQGVIANGSADLTPIEREGIQRDFSTVYNYDRRMANDILETSIMISEIQSDVVE